MIDTTFLRQKLSEAANDTAALQPSDNDICVLLCEVVDELRGIRNEAAQSNLKLTEIAAAISKSAEASVMGALLSGKKMVDPAAQQMSRSAEILAEQAAAPVGLDEDKPIEPIQMTEHVVLNLAAVAANDADTPRPAA